MDCVDTTTYSSLQEVPSLKEFLQLAFNSIDLDYRDYVIIDPKFYRPADVNLLHADPTKARKILGWKSTISFHDMISRMVNSDCRVVTECHA